MSSETIKLHTSRFGDLEVQQSSQIEIVGGLIGFPQFPLFVMLDYTEPFSWLQSTTNPDLAFVIVNAAEFGDSYVFDIPNNDTDLDIKENDDVAVFNVVSIRPNPRDSTVNLKAPVVVNLRNRRGRQIILDDQRYPTRMPLWSEETTESPDTTKK